MREAIQHTLDEFCSYCDEMAICLSVATLGVEEFRSKFIAHNPDPTKTLHVGPKLPQGGASVPAMNIGRFLEATKPSGAFHDRLAKSLLVSVYATWDEYYRPRIAKAANCDIKKVRCDLMGDLRLIRHCIVHGKSVLTTEPRKLKAVSWSLEPGLLTITRSMSDALAVDLRQLVIHIEGDA